MSTETRQHVNMPMYSFTIEQAGNLPLSLSIGCAEGYHGACTQWFRCDCQGHQREFPYDTHGRLVADSPALRTMQGKR